jgi:beta-glucosidase
MVLLKNSGVLPLDKSKLKNIAVIGPTAHPAVTGGGGSSKVKPFTAVSFLEGIRNYVGSGVTVSYTPGISTPSTDRALLQAKEAAAQADAVILCVGFDQSTESESFDRTFALPGTQSELISQILGVNKNVIVVLTAGGNVDMNGWGDSTPALLHTWYAGQEGGTALAQILFGEVSPSGKLPISLERRWEDNATYNSYYDPKLGMGQSGDARDPSGVARGHVAYKEGVLLGYRHFDKTGIKPLFPFGFGLSYTTFKYSNLKVTPVSVKGGKPVMVSFDITNTGKREGAEVAQVYVSDKHSKIDRPVKELKGFAKVSLKPGETRKVTVSLNRRAFSYYDVNGKRWRAEPGEFAILVGSSSAKTELAGKVRLGR